MKVKTVKSFVDQDGNVILTLTHMNNGKENISLGKIPLSIDIYM